jgi:hypothetical protein
MSSEALNLTILVYKDQFNKKTKLNGNFIFIPKIKKDGIKTIRLILQVILIFEAILKS